ncbi:protein phosphatase 2C domain-containing protein [Streptomyces sp. NPDC015220]|uniref:protein phosphatase 2C domain-containing protein n=1 Tax=Streptomyces sp. NPDC015220 TaxID=3364947 RepID=UPI0036FF1FFC
MSEQGGRPTGHEDDWWGQLYDDSTQDTGPTGAADSLDDRFASAADALEGAPGPARAEEPAPPERADDRSGPRAGGRTDDLTGGQTDDRADPRTDPRADPRADGWADDLTDDLTDELTDDLSGGLSDDWTVGRSGARTDGRTGGQAGGRPDPRADPRADGWADDLTDDQADDVADDLADGLTDDLSDDWAVGRPGARAEDPVGPWGEDPAGPWGEDWFSFEDRPPPPEAAVPAPRAGRPTSEPPARPPVGEAAGPAPEPPDRPPAEPPGRPTAESPDVPEETGPGPRARATAQPAGPPDTYPAPSRDDAPSPHGPDWWRRAPREAPPATTYGPTVFPPEPPPPEPPRADPSVGTDTGTRALARPPAGSPAPDDPAAPPVPPPPLTGPFAPASRPAPPRPATPPDPATPPRATAAVDGPAAHERHTGAQPSPPTVAHVGSGPPTYDAEPTALPVADPEELDDLVPDTVLDGARHGACTLRAVSVRGDSPRYRGEPRRDAMLTARFGTGEQALVLVAMATGARGAPGAHRAAAELCQWIARAVGRSHTRLAEDIRAARRGELKAGLHRLTDRGLGRLRAGAVERGIDPEEYAATLRCLLLPADPECRVRVFFGVGGGGLFRLRDGEWQDIEPALPEEAGPAAPVGPAGTAGPAAPVGPAGTDEGDRLSTAPGIPAPPSPYAPAPPSPPRPPREPFRFRASLARPGDVLLMCTGGLADPLRGEPELGAHLARRWSDPAPPGLAAFLADAQVRVKGYADDRTAGAVWEA